MAITDDFRTDTAMQYRIRHLERRVEELESGEAYARLLEESRSMRRGYERKIERLEKEAAQRDRHYRQYTKKWIEAQDAALREDESRHAGEVAALRRDMKSQEERALRAERVVDEQKDAIAALKARIADLEAKVAELEGQKAKLAATVSKDFTNSSIPSSKQGAGRKRIPNTRESSGKSPGAQPGHEHHPRKSPEADRTVVLRPPAEWEDDPDMYPTDEWRSKRLVSVKVLVTVTEYVAQVWRSRRTGGRFHAEFPHGLRDDVTYAPSCKALAFMLTDGCDTGCRPAAEFFREATGGRLDMSGGFVWKLGREFREKSAPEREEAVRTLMTSPVMHADFTNAMVGGRQRQVLILANEGGTCMMIPREHKGHKGVRGTPLEDYAGTVVSDHDTTWYKYGTRHQECHAHNVRYLIGDGENEPDLKWHKLMLKTIRCMLAYRNRIPEGGQPDPDTVARLERHYDWAIGLGEREYAEHPPTEYYLEGWRLLRRLRDYRDSELLFLHDMSVPADNSLAERLARVFKRKQHQATTFRSMEGLENACVAKSTIDNVRSAGGNVHDKLVEVFSRPAPAPLEPGPGVGADPVPDEAARE